MRLTALAAALLALTLSLPEAPLAQGRASGGPLEIRLVLLIAVASGTTTSRGSAASSPAAWRSC